MASEKGRQGLFRGEGEENTGETNQGQRDAGENHTQSQKSGKTGTGRKNGDKTRQDEDEQNTTGSPDIRIMTVMSVTAAFLKLCFFFKKGKKGF